MKLKIQDLRLFNLVFESDPGWILDFSNRTLSAFFDEELNIDIDDECYKEEGTSKAKRVRCLLKQVDRETALRVLDTLWRYKMETMPEQAEQSRNDWLALISRLKKLPTTVILMPSTIPLLPGSSIYYTMLYAITSDNDKFLNYAKSTVLTGLGISLGAVIATVIIKILSKKRLLR